MRANRILPVAALLLGGWTAAASAQERQPTLLATAEALRGAVSPDEIRSAAWLDSPASLPLMGRLVGEVAGERASGITVVPFDRVYLAYEGSRPAVGDRVLLVHVGDEVTGRGHMIEPRALLRIEQLDAEVMVAQVVEQYGWVDKGDVVVPLHAAPDLRGRFAQPVDGGPSGEVLAFRVSHALQAPPDEAFVSLGAADGLALGDELTAYLPRRVMENGRALTLPAEVVAHLLVVRVEERSATVRVLDLEQPAVLEPGLPVRVTAKMP